MAQTPWTIENENRTVRIEYPGGLYQEMPLATATRFFQSGLNVCSNSSAVATAPRGRPTGAKTKKKTGMKKGR